MSAWRYRCPNGHVNWRANSKRNSIHSRYDDPPAYYCRTCETGFAKLTDQKTGKAKASV